MIEIIKSSAELVGEYEPEKGATCSATSYSLDKKAA